MLLLILFAECVALCAAQTVPKLSTSTSAIMTPTMTPTPFTQPVQATSVTSHSQNVVAVLLAAVQSSHELNETIIVPVLNEIRKIIETFQPDINFNITVKNITKV